MKCKKARLDDEPLWLTVVRDGKSKSYEFPPGGDDTAVVVGSSDRAQIHIAGAASIAFYVERVENDLCITSCYLGSDLCVDGHVVGGRCTIVRRATVEVAGVRLTAMAESVMGASVRRHGRERPRRVVPIGAMHGRCLAASE